MPTVVSAQLLQALNSLERDVNCLLNEKVVYNPCVPLSTFSLSYEKLVWGKHLYPNNAGAEFSPFTCSYSLQPFHEICFIAQNFGIVFSIMFARTKGEQVPTSKHVSINKK